MFMASAVSDDYIERAYMRSFGAAIGRSVGRSDEKAAEGREYPPIS